MSIGSSPPQTPPQLSPDGRWVWDGHQWQPVPVVVGDMAGFVPVVAEAAAPARAAVVTQYSPPQVQAPAIPYAVPTAEESAVPLWEEPRQQGISIYLFGAAALVVLIMAMMGLNSLNIVRLPWQSDGQTQVRATPTPLPPLATRSDYARADRFLNFSLSPAVVALNKTLPAIGQTCIGVLTNSCLNSVTASDQQLKKVLAVIDGADIAPCIAPGASKIRVDFAQMDDGLQLAVKGFQDQNKSEVGQGLTRFASVGTPLQADAKALDQALKTQCSTDPTGP